MDWWEVLGGGVMLIVALNLILMAWSALHFRYEERGRLAERSSTSRSR